MNKETNNIFSQPARKSDRIIVPKKQANKELPKSTAEFVEGRVLTKRNLSELNRSQTQSWIPTMSGLARVRERAKKDPTKSFTALMHHITPELLKESFQNLSRRSAPGIDGTTWKAYGDSLEDRLEDLYKRLHGGGYRPRPVRRVYIPKEDGTERPLSILCIEDKIVQQALVTALNQIYEPDFLGFSYGFRPGRGQHNALDALAYGITKRKVNWVLDLDVQKFFDTVDHAWLLKMIQHRVKDSRVLSLIMRWIQVGFVDKDGKRIPQKVGVPQGAVISPLLANIYLHYVFDLWSHQWRKNASGEIIITRFADDVVLGFQHKTEAESYLKDLHLRFGKFGLKLHPLKTKLIRFGRYALSQYKKLGVKVLETFTFLGFTHYCTVKQNGEFKLGRRTQRQRMAKQIKLIQKEMRRRMHSPVKEMLSWLRSVLLGHFNYYGVPGNINQLASFRDEIVKRLLKTLRRRSQRSKLTWDKFAPLTNAFLPRPKVVHEYPEARFRAKYSR
ncbi:MAG: group II intron reverse transcriptase/maturase [Simkaniaceae bacterium]|jgi:group II intron reverse transcriptase/maturase|nr:group II intron reverse transcriptase/maturase [Simkaniaceae bacterium]